MSGNKCSYVDCTNSARKTPGLRKFYFPIRDQGRCKKWISLCGNPSLVDLDDDELKKHFLCHEHFPDELLGCRKLPPGALPIDYAEAKSQLCSVVRTYSRHSNSRETEVSSEVVSLPEKNAGRKSFTSDDSTGRSGMPLKKQPEPLHPTGSPAPSVEEAVEFPSSSECREKYDEDKLKRKIPLGALPIGSSKARLSKLIPVLRTYSKQATSKKTTASSEKTRLTKKSTCCRLLKSNDSVNKTDTPIKKKKQLEVDPDESLTIRKRNKRSQASNPWQQEYIEQIIGSHSPPEHKEMPLPSKPNFLRNVESLPDLPRIVVKMQLNHRPGTPWTPEEEDAAIVLYNKSPSMYRFLIENGFILPSENTVCK